MYLEKFVANLNELFRASGVSNEKVASATGISRSALGHWRNGVREPKLEAVCALADYFDVSLDELVGRRDY